MVQRAGGDSRLSRLLCLVLLLAFVVPADAPDGFLAADYLGSQSATIEARLAAITPEGVLTLTEAALADETLSPIERGRLVTGAWNYLGVRYRYGGQTRGGIDCSGLVRRLLLAQDIAAPRTVHEFWGVSAPVDEPDRRPGDLVFFRLRGGAVSHVGIYLGGQSFIHAAVTKGVMVSSLDDPYYARSYAGARRLQ